MTQALRLPSPQFPIVRSAVIISIRRPAVPAAIGEYLAAFKAPARWPRNSRDLQSNTNLLITQFVGSDGNTLLIRQLIPARCISLRRPRERYHVCAIDQKADPAQLISGGRPHGAWRDRPPYVPIKRPWPGLAPAEPGPSRLR
jgi:hypothetical protein